MNLDQYFCFHTMKKKDVLDCHLVHAHLRSKQLTYRYIREVSNLNLKKCVHFALVNTTYHSKINYERLVFQTGNTKPRTSASCGHLQMVVQTIKIGGL